MDLTIEKIESMKIGELRSACKVCDLPGGGSKEELQARLLGSIAETLTRPKAQRYIGASQDRCRVCKESVKITGTKTSKMDDGRTLIVRQVQCKGKNRHTFNMKEITGSKNTDDLPI